MINDFLETVSIKFLKETPQKASKKFPKKLPKNLNIIGIEIAEGNRIKLPKKIPKNPTKIAKKSNKVEFLKRIRVDILKLTGEGISEGFPIILRKECVQKLPKQLPKIFLK